MLDRIDIHLEVLRFWLEHLTDRRRGEPSEAIRGRIDSAREVQKARYTIDGVYCNTRLESKDLEQCCILDKDSADLDEKMTIKAHHISEAI